MTEMEKILIAMLQKFEGFSKHAYLDSENLPTVGYGRLLTGAGPGWDGKHYAAASDFNDEYPDGISMEAATRALLEDADQGIKDARTLVESVSESGSQRWAALSPLRQAILASIAFNLGRARFAKFRGVWRGVSADDPGKVAVELLDSRRARQIKRRAALEAVAYCTDWLPCLELPPDWRVSVEGLIT